MTEAVRVLLIQSMHDSVHEGLSTLTGEVHFISEQHNEMGTSRQD